MAGASNSIGSDISSLPGVRWSLSLLLPLAPSPNPLLLALLPSLHFLCGFRRSVPLAAVAINGHEGWFTDRSCRDVRVKLHELLQGLVL